MAWEGLTDPVPLLHGWAGATVLGAVKDARPWRAPLRDGLRPSLTAPARRDAPKGVGTGSRPDLRLRLRQVEQEAADKEAAMGPQVRAFKRWLPERNRAAFP